MGSIIEGVPHESNPEGGDRSGFSVSLSNDGTIVAIGGPEHTGENNSYEAGHVRVFKFENNSWDQLGQDIDGDEKDFMGYSVSLSGDGKKVAVGAPDHDGNGLTNSGQVRAYKYENNSWTQLGSDIDGEQVEYRTGHSVSLSDDGMTLAVSTGDCDCDEDGTVNSGIRGHIKVLKYSNTSNDWIKLGDSIAGEIDGDRFGDAVAISDDGTRVVGGAKYNRNHPIGNASGHIRVFEYQDNSSSWVQLGDDIDGNTSTNDEIGFSVTISNDGKKVIGGGINSNSGTGIVRGYEFRDPHVTLSSASLLPEVAEAIKFHEENGADFIQMTGTGSSVFGLYSKASPLLKTVAEERGWRAYLGAFL